MPYINSDDVRDEFSVEVDGRHYGVKLYRGSFHATVDREAVRSESLAGLRDFVIPRTLKRRAEEREDARVKAEAARDAAKKRESGAFDAMMRTKDGLIKVRVRGRDPRTSAHNAKYLITRPDGSKDSVGPYGLMAIVSDEDRAVLDALIAEAADLSAAYDNFDKYRDVSAQFSKEKFTAEWDREGEVFFVTLDDGTRIESTNARDLNSKVEVALVARSHPFTVDYHSPGDPFTQGTYTIEPLTSSDTTQHVFQTEVEAEAYITHSRAQSANHKAKVAWDAAHRLPLDD